MDQKYTDEKLKRFENITQSDTAQQELQRNDMRLLATHLGVIKKVI